MKSAKNSIRDLTISAYERPSKNYRGVHNTFKKVGGVGRKRSVNETRAAIVPIDG